MFGFKNKKGKVKDFLNKDDFQAENIPIHTMQRDMESLKPSEKRGGEEPQESTPRLPNISSKNKTVSPFLGKNLTPKASVEPSSAYSNENFSEPRPETQFGILPESKIEDSPVPPAPNLKKVLPENSNTPSSWSEDLQDNDEKSNKIKKLAIALVLIFLITATAAGGYYYWSQQKDSFSEEFAPAEMNSENKSEISLEKEVVVPEELSTPKFSTTEKNFLMLSLADYPNDLFHDLARKYFSDIVSYKISYPVEFTIIDTGNSLVSFKTFSEKMGMGFSPEFLSALEDNFNLYIYNDQGNIGIGLALKVRASAVPEEILLREENNLSEELKPILPISQNAINGSKTFSTTEYDSPRWGKVGIRFQNIDSQKNLSVDYALLNTGSEMLLIGTSKNTLRSVIENLKPVIASP